MSCLKKYVQQLEGSYHPPFKHFWGNSDNLSLGVGLVYDHILYPLLDIQQGLFDTVSGLVLILTHECDISQDNKRIFNEEILICPITPFEYFIEEYTEILENNKTNKLDNFILELSKNNISRVMYLPVISDKILPHGGLIYLNQITSTHISMFDDKSAIAAISARALDKLSHKIQNHLLRPKTEKLPLSR